MTAKVAANWKERLSIYCLGVFMGVCIGLQLSWFVLPHHH